MMKDGPPTARGSVWKVETDIHPNQDLESWIHGGKGGIEGWAVKEVLMFQQKLSCIREEEGGSLGRRNSAVPAQQRKNKAKYPVLIFWKTLFQLHPVFLLRRLWLASLFPCALFSQDLICSFPGSQRLGIWDRSKNKLSECNCHPRLVLGFGTELEYPGYLVI